MAEKRKRKLKLAAYLRGAGNNIAGWRHHATPSDAPVNIRLYKEIVLMAEEAKFDFAFLADSAYITKESAPYYVSRFDPIVAMSALASVTSRIGFVPTMTTSFSYPYTTARQLASLDKLSEGRAGWNAVTSAIEQVARNFNGDKLYEHEVRYQMAEEYIKVVKGLWDSWEDDAFVRDKESGLYVNFDKMHQLNHQGEYFSVQGPLNMERSPQGRPVVFQAGASEAGKNLAAREADGVFSSTDNLTLENVIAYAQDLKRRAAGFGRNPDDILIFPAMTPIIGRTKQEAEEKYQSTLGYIDDELAVKYLSRFFSFFDFSQFPLDKPLPPLEGIGSNSFKSGTEKILKLAREQNLTLRELAQRIAAPKGDFVGTAEEIADKMQLFYESGAVDGYMVAGDVQPEGLREFIQHVVPILQERGIFRTEYEADTLRGNLGLEYPVNRYTLAGQRG